MAKQKRVACSTQDGKCRKEDNSVDRISMLSDELLGLILSHLTFKEATSTSILSQRWRYLWTLTSRLDFNGIESIMKGQLAKRNRALALHEERSNYVRWVNHVIALRKESAIEDFKVFFNLSKSYQGCIDEWLKYALARKVQTLELDLSRGGWGDPVIDEEFYSFPHRFLHMDKSIHFKQLEKISLSYINVNGEALEFLYNCPLLEDLSVSQSRELLTLRIIGPFPSLKCLEIRWCHNLNLVEIRDVNIVYLKYGGKRIQFLLHNVPMLVNIFVGACMNRMGHVLGQFSSILLQLEILDIDISCPLDGWEPEMLVKMSNLKQLVVRYSVLDDSLLPLTNLICAAPCLEKFVLKTRLHGKFRERKIRKVENLYSHLKEVEFVGYCGLLCELELVMHFVENAVALEKIIVDPRKFYESSLCREISYDSNSIKEEINARAQAKKQLMEKVPTRINLEIL